eukprot:PhF_6_TR33027/c0_g4_i1/m.48686
MNYEIRLTNFYKKYNPAKVSSVKETLHGYQGEEEQLFKMLVDKYGPEPPDYRSRLIRFYTKYNPGKLGSVDEALEGYAGQEEELFSALVGKYGPEPEASVPQTPSNKQPA